MSILAIPAAFGQFATTQSPLDGTTPVIDQAVSPDAVYHLSGFDTVSIPSGHLNFALPLVNIPGRGAAKTAAEFRIGSSWKVISVPIPNCNQNGCSYTYSYAISFGPWYADTMEPSYAGALMIARGAGDSCDGGQTNNYFANSLTRLTYIKEDGGETEFRDTATGGKPHANFAPGAFSRGTSFEAFDGSSSVFTAAAAVSDPGSCSSASSGISGVLTSRDGTRHTFSNGYEVKTEDRNGNELCLSSDCTTSGSAPSQVITDSFGRTTTVSACTGCDDSIVYPGYHAASRTITVKHASLCGSVSGLTCSSGSLLRGDYKSLSSYSQMFAGTSLCTQNISCTTTAFDPNDLVSEVDLPDSTSYKFFYNPFGDLAEVDLPTGGSYQYDYSLLVQGTGGPPSPYNYTIARLLTAKRVYSGGYGSTLEQTITYTAPESGSTTVTYLDGSGNSLGTELHTYTAPNSSPNVNGTQYAGWKEGLETQITYTDSLNNLLKTEVDAWQQRMCPGSGNECWFTGGGVSSCNSVNDSACPSHDPQLLSDQTAYNAVTTQNAYLYDLYNNKIQVTESAFGNGSPGGTTRTTTTTYETGSSYLSANLLNLPLVESVYSGTTSGTLEAQTTWNYDQSTIPPTQCAGIIEHDPVYGTSFTTRGNATSVAKLVKGAAILTTLQEFDIAGNLVKSVDQRGVEADFSYADSGNLYALPISGTRYTGLNTTGISGTATGTALSENVVYDYNIQKPTEYLDFNAQQTKYAYIDTLDRITNITRPDNGQTNFTYADAPGSFSSHTAQDKDTPGDGLIASQIDYDGLGRKSVTWYQAPEGQIQTCFAYDGKNRLASSSNPNNGSCSTLLTTYSYDVLDRKVTVTAQDGSITSYVYKGDAGSLTNTTLEVEPPLGTTQTNGNNHLSYMDAQGRLVEVDENVLSWQGKSYGQSSQPTYKTTYGYDALDDLMSVTQGSQSRSFVYDDLKRLLTATNPESGTLTYTYDNSGNLLTRADQRIVPGTSNPFTATYAYDGMNRLTTKSYNDSTVSSPNVPTPWVSLYYDQGGSAALANGRLTETFANYQQYNRSYDVLGRVASSAQITGGKTYNMTYAYNLASGLMAFTYPSGRVATTSYDAANRISQVQDVYNENTSTHASAVSYWPNRVIESMVLGHQNLLDVSIAENTTLNSRLQVSNRNVQIGAMFPVQLAFTYGTSGKNSGNLTAQQIQTIAAPNPPPGVSIPTLNLTQTYGYDAYDRLLSATESGGSSEWSQTYLYDQWGNRAVQSGSYLPNPNGTPTAVAQFTNNRWIATGTAYDSAGDATGVPGTMNETFTYDGEYRVNTAIAGGTIGYIYDGEGRRVQKTSSPSTFTTTYVYDTTGKVILENTVPTAGTSYPTEAPLTGTEYLTQDHLGSTRLSLNNQGQVVKRYDYLPFGEELRATVGGRGADYDSATYGYPTTPDDVLRKFTGKERDAESGLDYFGARYMSSAQGRFTSVDPDLDLALHLSDPQGWNGYAYARNNPLKYTDPSGENYTVCDTNGKNCADLTDSQYNDYLKSSSSIYQTAGGSLYSVNQDGSDTKVGSATYYNEKDGAGADQIGAQQLLINEFLKQAAINAVAGVAGRLIGAGVEAFFAARAASTAAAAVDVANLSNKIVRQMASRGWTAQEIVETVQNGKAYGVINKATGGAATEYINPANGKFVVVDNATKQVLQVSGPGFSPNHLGP